jgi:hypothetical protein
MGSIPIARSITHDDSIVLTPLSPLISAIKPGVLVPRWSQRNKLVPTSQPEVGGNEGTTVRKIGPSDLSATSHPQGLPESANDKPWDIDSGERGLRPPSTRKRGSESPQAAGIILTASSNRCHILKCGPLISKTKLPAEQRAPRRKPPGKGRPGLWET